MGTLSRPTDMTDLESILEKNTDIKATPHNSG